MRFLDKTNLRFPALQRACIGLWAPSLGPTGLRLQDVSGFRRNGSLVNGPAWAVNGPGYVVSTDTTDDYLNLGTSADFSPSRMTVSIWVRRVSTPFLYAPIIGRTASGSWNTGWGMWWNDASTVVFHIQDYGLFAASYTGVNSANWNNIIGTWDGTTVSVYVNGVKGSTDKTYTGSVSATTQPLLVNKLHIDDAVWGCHVGPIQLWRRQLTTKEIRLMALRQSVAFETGQRRRASGLLFNRRRRLLIGAGS